jgi:hypothetical protein
VIVKLATLIKEALDIARKRYSWLTPYGAFIPVKYSHGSDAVSFTGNQKDPIMSAWKKGYIRVVFNGNVLIAHNEVMPPNEKQKSKLIDLAKETGDYSIEYDSGKNQKILWSIHDILN